MSYAQDTGDSGPLALDPAQRAKEPDGAERRRHKRVDIHLLGRFMRESKQEYPCKILNMSAGGVAMLTPIEGDMGEHIIAYVDHIGRIEGKVSRKFDGGFAIKIKATPYKQEKIASQLTWLSNKKELDLSDERRHERIVPRNTDTALKFANGDSMSCRLLDVSLSGASVSMDPKPDLGLEVRLGKMRGRIVRHHENGVGIEFLDIQNPNALSNYFT